MFRIALLVLAVFSAANLQAASGFNSPLALRVYARGSEDRADRLIGTTPLPRKQVLRLPAQGAWYVEPIEPLTGPRLKKLLIEVNQHQIPGLDLSGHEEVNDAMLKILTRAPHLRILLLARTSITTAGLAHLNAFPHLTILSLNDGVTPAGLRALKDVKGLEDLDLSELRMTSEGVARLPSFPRLQRLVLPEFSWTESALSNVASNGNLQFVVIGGELTADAIRVLGRLSRLRGLDLQRAQFPSGALKGLASLKNLETLYLPTRFADKDVKALASLPKLKSLDVTGAALTPAILKRIGKISSLQALALTDSELHAKDLRALQALTQLTLLELSGTKIASGELDVLKNFTALRVLALPQAELSGPDRLVLSALPQLSVIALAGQPAAPQLYADLRAIATKPIAEKPVTVKSIARVPPPSLPASKTMPRSTDSFTAPTIASIPKAPAGASPWDGESGTVWKNKVRPGIRLGEDKSISSGLPTAEIRAVQAVPVASGPSVPKSSTPKPTVSRAQLAGLSGIQRLRALSENQVAISDIIPADNAEIKSFEETPQNSLGEFEFRAK